MIVLQNELRAGCHTRERRRLRTATSVLHRVRVGPLTRSLGWAPSEPDPQGSQGDAELSWRCGPAAAVGAREASARRDTAPRAQCPAPRVLGCHTPSGGTFCLGADVSLHISAAPKKRLVSLSLL